MTRRFVAHDDRLGTLVAVDVQKGGVPLPAFTYGAARPLVGQMKGQAFIDENTGIASVWDGNTWTDIAKPVIITKPTETALLATQPPDDQLSYAQDTGNFFVRYGGGWRQVGLRNYDTLADLLASGPTEGQLGYAVDVRAIFAREGVTWVPISQAVADHEGDVLADNPPWDAAPDGLAVLATDTGRVHVKTANGWVGSPVQYYRTEADLLAAAPANGTIAFTDTGEIYARAQGAWRGVNQPPGWRVITSVSDEQMHELTVDWSTYAAYKVVALAFDKITGYSDGPLNCNGVQTSSDTGVTRHQLHFTAAGTERDIVPDGGGPSSAEFDFRPESYTTYTLMVRRQHGETIEARGLGSSLADGKKFAIKATGTTAAVHIYGLRR